MKRFLARAAATAFASASSFVSVGFAEEPKSAPPARKVEERPKAEPAAPRGGGADVMFFSAPAFPQFSGKAAAAAYIEHIEHIDKITKLTAEQKQKIEQLYHVRELEMRALQAVIAAKSQSLAQDMSRAVQLKDQELIAKVRKSYQELYAPLSEQAKKSEAALDAVFTAEQKAQVQAAEAAVPKHAGAAAANPTNLGFLAGKALFTFAQPLDQAEFEKRKREFEKRAAEQRAEHEKHASELKADHEKRMIEHKAELQRRMQTMFKGPEAAHHDALRDRVRRQRELTRKSAKIVKKLDELDSQESPKARDLWKQLQQVQIELQQTFGGPQAFSISTMPGQPAGAWVVQSGSGMVSSGTVSSDTVGAGAVGFVTGGEGGIIVSSSGQPQGNPAPVRIETRQLMPQPNNMPQPATAEVVKALETLRRQVEELQSQVRKLSEK